MIYEILTELKATSSRNEKLLILNKNKKNELLMAVVKAALDPHINFFIRKIPEYTPAKKPTIMLDFALQQLERISNRDVTGHAALTFLTDSLLSRLSRDDAGVLSCVVLKDLDCGIQESTANKVWEGLVPNYPCMLASKFEDKLVDKMTFPAIVQTKFDGMRFNAIVKGGKVEYRSRNGKPLNLMGNLDDEFIKMSRELDFVFDGELLVRRDGKILSRQEGNGILQKANKGTITSGEAGEIIARVWDAIPYPHFLAGKSTLEYFNRLMFLSDIPSESEDSKVLVASTVIVNSLKETQKLYEKALAAGEEGVMLKAAGEGWEDKRVKHQIKFKNELEADLLCIGWEEGTKKNKGKLGALVLTTADRKLNVSVGTGLTDSNRNSIKKEDVLNKVISIKYNAMTQDKNGEYSLFLPVFVEIREDKTKADKLKDLE